MITDKLKSLIADHLKTTLISSGEVGLGGNNTSPAATALDVPTGAATTIVIQKSDENVIEVKVSVAGSNISGQVIRELGLFDASSNMLDRVNFDGVGPFASNETLELFLTIEVE